MECKIIKSKQIKHSCHNRLEVVIRTNGGKLTVNDESTGTIKHYGKAGSVNIIECHTASYHEYGTVPFIEIAEGRLVLEAGSDVNGVHVDKEYTVKPTAESEGEKAASTFGNVEISVASGVDMPKFSRDAVSEIADAGTKVCTIDLANEKNDVILFIDGIYEQIKIENTTDGARWVDTSNATQATKTAADQLANNIGGAKGTDYTITGDGETAGSRTIEVINSEVAVVTEGGKDAAKAQVASALKGDGLSWETAFEIYDYDTMQMITQFANIDYYYFKVNIDKTDNGKIDCRNDWHSVTLFGNFDGSGVVFENLNKGLFGAVGKNNDAAAAKYTYYVKDFTISNCNINSTWGWGVAAYTNGNVTLEDISISGTITGTTSVGSFVEMGYLNGDVLFKNCVSTCNLVCDTAGGFFAHAYQAGNITLDNSYFNGTAYIGNGGGSVNYISGNSTSSTTKQVIFKNMSDTSGYTLPEGILTQENGFTKDTFNCTWTQGINGIKSSKKAGSNAVMTNINNITETFSVGDTISIEALTDTKTAKFIVMIAPNDSTGYGGYLTEYAREMVDVSNGTISSSSVRYCNVTVDKNRAMGYYNNNTVYNVNQNGWGPSYGAAYIEIQEYNSTNTLIRISRIALPAYSAK